MATVKTWGMDGTFKHFAIHAFVASKLVLVVCCYVRLKILANKTSINKAAVFSVNLYPQTIINPKRRGGTSLVYEGRAYKLRYTGKRVKNWGCSKDKKECKGGLTTNLDVTGVLRQTPHGDSCPVYEHIAYKIDKRTILRKRSAEEAKTIPQIHDEEAASISAEPSTFSQFPFFREERSAMCKQRAKRFPTHPRNRQDVVLGTEFTRTKFGEVFLLTQSASNHIPVFSTANNIRLLSATKP
ncbi:hypothetical protein T03_7680 [Trichinella britovi]|uniref:FLYWCH-type domain-containing protein n=1 Tax=Trichinella britovi TaxID=45882 RepID=A0A0V1D0I2_TRIBR|nr:hypothetical protein T03_7680 [Trichinella britovi]